MSKSEDLGAQRKLVFVITVAESLALLTGQLAYANSQGYEVIVVSSGGQLADRLGEEGARHKTIFMSRKISLWRDIVSLWKLFFFFRKEKPHIVNAGTPKAGLLGVLAARLSGVPVIVRTVRGLRYETLSGLRKRVVQITTKVGCYFADTVVCVSHSLREQAIQDGVIPQGKSLVLGEGSSNGVDVHRFDRTPQVVKSANQLRKELGVEDISKVVGFIGRVTKDKGISVLLRAWEIIAKEHPFAHLIVAGFIDWEGTPEREVLAELQNNPRIHAIGFVKDIPTVFAAIDVLLFPTKREGFSNVLLQAAAMQVPVVTSRVTGCTDVVLDGETGFLVPPEQAKVFANKVCGYLADGDLCAEHGQRARQRAIDNFSHKDVVHRYHEHYELLMSKKLV